MNVPQYEMLGNKPGNVKYKDHVAFKFSFRLLCLSFQIIYRYATLVPF